MRGGEREDGLPWTSCSSGRTCGLAGWESFVSRRGGWDPAEKQSARGPFDSPAQHTTSCPGANLGRPSSSMAISVSSAVAGGATSVGSVVSASCISTRSSSSRSAAGRGVASGAAIGWASAVGAGIVTGLGWIARKVVWNVPAVFRSSVELLSSVGRFPHRLSRLQALAACEFGGGVRNSFRKSGPTGKIQAYPLAGCLPEHSHILAIGRYPAIRARPGLAGRVLVPQCRVLLCKVPFIVSAC